MFRERLSSRDREQFEILFFFFFINLRVQRIKSPILYGIKRRKKNERGVKYRNVRVYVYVNRETKGQRFNIND